jgi:hypothetical protein
MLVSAGNLDYYCVSALRRMISHVVRRPLFFPVLGKPLSPGLERCLPRAGKDPFPEAGKTLSQILVHSEWFIKLCCAGFFQDIATGILCYHF